MAITTLNRTLDSSRESGHSDLARSTEFRRTATVPQTVRSNVGLSSDRLKSVRSQVVPVATNHSDRLPVMAGRSRGLWKWMSFAFLASGTAAVYQPWNSSNGDSHASAAHATDVQKTVDTQRPTLAGTSNVVLPATFRAWQTTALSARVSGYLTRWHRDLGEHVTAGELLAEIETPELDQEVAAAESSAREADAAALQATAERTEAESDLKATQAQLVRVQAELDLARSQLARREKLVTSKVITQEEFDSFTREVEARTAVVAAAEADVTRRRANLTTRSAIIDARYATARSRQSNVERLQELQGFKRIVAPFDGVVTRRSAEIGMLVTAGRETLFVIEDMSRVRVQISVPQAYSMQTVPGVVATVTVPESSIKSIPGTITRVSSSVDSASRTMLAEIELENSLLNLQPGSYAQVTLNTVQDYKTWTVPTNTVLMRVDGPHVAVVDDQNQIEMRQVRLGRDFGSRVAVVTGIHGNERLVVNPGDELKNGMQIQANGQSPQGQEVVLK